MIIDQLPSANPNLTDETVTEQGTNLFKTTWQKIRDLFLGSSASFASDVTVGGVLDVTQRRCSAVLSSPGWYRVIASSQAENRVLPGGLRGAILDLKITTSMGTSNESEEHEIILFQGTHEVSFMYELSSTSATKVIDKVRYTYKPSNDYGYIDLHFDASFDVSVTVYFSVSIDPTLQHTYAPDGLSAVAASPSSEIILAEHNFYANNYPVNVVEPTTLITSGTIAAGGTMTYTATKSCWVYLMFVMQANSSGSILVKINNVSIINWTSGEAVPLNLSFLPIPLMKGDTIYVSQSSGRSSSYSIFAMR